jgi:hypothetical protein
MRARIGRLSIFSGTALCVLAAAHAQTEIRLWPGKAAGSEQWSAPEATTRSPSGDRVITNVSDPTLTVFLPDPKLATVPPPSSRARWRAARARVR